MKKNFHSVNIVVSRKQQGIPVFSFVHGMKCSGLNPISSLFHNDNDDNNHSEVVWNVSTGTPSLSFST